ncbi:tyrosine-protein kinase TXK-like isoform X4 [Macrobrachium nipponense]|uniref:tyrosine-protein kinase TXK-like isoform X4 n=1 Tax=Macrobrachium nipponense TaxID=159736 RepID=UPI0030C8387E
MSDYIGDAMGWGTSRMMHPVSLVSTRDTANTTWHFGPETPPRLPPRPFKRPARSATITCRAVSGTIRRRISTVAPATWGTLDPLSQSLDEGQRGADPPLVTVHVRNNSCAASGSEAFFNLTQHGGRRGTALSRSSSCVSALSRGSYMGSYMIHGLSPSTPPIIPSTHCRKIGRSASMAPSTRRVRRSYSVAPADTYSSSVGIPAGRVVGRRAQRQQTQQQHQPVLVPCFGDQPVHQNQRVLNQLHQNPFFIQHQPEALKQTVGSLERGLDEAVTVGECGSAMPRLYAPVVPPPLPPSLPPPAMGYPPRWRPREPPSTCCGCLCQNPCSVGILIARFYKALLKVASSCMFHKYKGEFDLMTANGQPTPSPTPDARSEMMPGTPGGRFKPPERQRKVVVALYDYNAIDPGDIPLRKHEEFEVIEDTQEYWWKMKNLQTGVEGFAPSNYVREKETLGLHQYDWYLGDATRQRAEVFLMQQEREGCFVVRNSTTNSGIYTLSLFSKRSHPQVKHYHIKKDPEGNYYLSHNIKCQTIPDLIFRHQHNPAGLPVRLRPPTHGRHAPTIPGPHPDKWEIDPNELNLLEELGSGQFGVVRHGKLRNLDVAVKMMKEGTMSENDFIEEAQVMTKLRHPNLVQLYGVCSMYRPIYIVTEYLKNGSLLNYLRSKDKVLINNNEILLDMCLQVCEGMAYLERQKFIHRDLAARNCLVGAHGEIKVGDFGLARHVVDDEYTGSGGAKFPIKWAAPEVLNFMRFSSKSDVWAYGVLMWEVFSCGKMPYGKAKNTEVVEMVVQKGCVLDKPRFCPDNVYNVMRKCWDRTPEMRPAFSDIIRIFQDE